MNADLKKAMFNNHRGIELARQGKNRLALKSFNIAIQNYPTLPLSKSHDMKYRLYSNRGLTKEHLRDFHGALADYNQALELNPQYAIGYCNRGGVKYNLKKYTDSIKDFKLAIKYHKNYEKAYFFLGMAQSRAGQKDNAILTFTLLVKVAPKIFIPYYERGCVELALNLNDRALKDFKKAAQLHQEEDATQVAILNNLGVAQNKQKHYQNAITTLKDALKIIPHNASLLANLRMAQQGLKQVK